MLFALYPTRLYSPMTCRTLLGHGFVNDEHGLILQSFGNMTFFTRDFFMRTVQFETAVAIMHEQQFVPMCGLMAFLAAGFFLFAELAAMHVAMTIPTTKRQRAIAHRFIPRCIAEDRQAHDRRRRGVLRYDSPPCMTFFARHALMRSLQSKARRVVIELRFVPAFVAMTNLAAAFFHLRSKLSRVRIGMASCALLLWKNEEQLAGKRARSLSRVTLSARCR